MPDATEHYSSFCAKSHVTGTTQSLPGLYPESNPGMRPMRVLPITLCPDDILIATYTYQQPAKHPLFKAAQSWQGDKIRRRGGKAKGIRLFWGVSRNVIATTVSLFLPLPPGAKPVPKIPALTHPLPPGARLVAKTAIRLRFRGGRYL